MLSSLTAAVTMRVTQLAVINLTALGLIAVGFGVAGLGPALVACFWATARLDDRMPGDLMRGMLAEARREAVWANLLLLPVWVLIAFLTGATLLTGGPLAGIVAALAVLVAAFALAIVVTLAALSGSVRDGWANAATAMSLAPYRLLISLACLPPVILTIIWQPPLGLFFGLSAWAWLAHHIVSPGLASAIPNKEVRP